MIVAAASAAAPVVVIVVVAWHENDECTFWDQWDFLPTLDAEFVTVIGMIFVVVCCM